MKKKIENFEYVMKQVTEKGLLLIEEEGAEINEVHIGESMGKLKAIYRGLTADGYILMKTRSLKD